MRVRNYASLTPHQLVVVFAGAAEGACSEGAIRLYDTGQFGQGAPRGFALTRYTAA